MDRIEALVEISARGTTENVLFAGPNQRPAEHVSKHAAGMPVTLEECEELAADEGAPDGWTLAARYAARMLPQIFRPDDPVLQVGFAPEHERAMVKLVIELPIEVFTAEDSLGWVYQFWQAERKDARAKDNPLQPIGESHRLPFAVDRICAGVDGRIVSHRDEHAGVRRDGLKPIAGGAVQQLTGLNVT